jgi:hypothetical protein
MNNLISKVRHWFNKNVTPLLVYSGKRFPETLILSVLLGLLMVLNNQLFDQNSLILDLSQSLFLTLPLSFIFVIVRETFSKITWTRWIDRVVLLMIIGGYYGFLQLETSPLVEFTWFSNLMTSFYLIPVFLPYLFKPKGLESFVVFTFTLFLTAMFYAFTLFVGISIILGAATILFNFYTPLTMYTNFLIGSLTLVFVPTFLAGYPLQRDLFDYDHVAKVWKRIFTFVIAPVISIFSMLIILYLLTFLLGNTTYDVSIYTFSTLVIAFGGIASHVLLKANPTPSRFENFFIHFFPYVLILVIFGFYMELIRSGLDSYFSISLLTQMYLGVWPLVYIGFAIRKPRVASEAGFLSLTSLYVLMVITPFANVVSLSSMSLEAKLKSVLVSLDMYDGDSITPLYPIPADEYEIIYNLVEDMVILGAHRFDILPNDFSFLDDFANIFGTRGDTEVDNTILLGTRTPIFDLAAYDFDYLINIPNLSLIQYEAVEVNGLSIQYVDSNTNTHELVIGLEALEETVLLYEDVALVLADRHGQTSNLQLTIEDMTVVVDTPSFEFTFFVTYLDSYEDTTGIRLLLSMFVGVNVK